MTITYLGVIRHGKYSPAVVASCHSRFAAPIATGAANLSADPATTHPGVAGHLREHEARDGFDSRAPGWEGDTKC